MLRQIQEYDCLRLWELRAFLLWHLIVYEIMNRIIDILIALYELMSCKRCEYWHLKDWFASLSMRVCCLPPILRERKELLYYRQDSKLKDKYESRRQPTKLSGKDT